MNRFPGAPQRESKCGRFIASKEKKQHKKLKTSNQYFERLPMMQFFIFKSYFAVRFRSKLGQKQSDYRGRIKRKHAKLSGFLDDIWIPGINIKFFRKTS